MSYDPASKFGRAYKREQGRRWRDRDLGARNRVRRMISYYFYSNSPNRNRRLAELRKAYALYREVFSMPRGRTPRHASH